jgi:GNAT superfamily N-acetyltransferase
MVADIYQGHGLGSMLVGTMLDVARHEGVTTIRTVFNQANATMRRLCEKFHFEQAPSEPGYVDMRVQL